MPYGIHKKKKRKEKKRSKRKEKKKRKTICFTQEKINFLSTIFEGCGLVVYDFFF